MNPEVNTWLAQHFSTTPHNIQNILSEEKATTYLLIWPILEQELFNGFMRESEISTFASNFEPYYEELNVDTAVKHFYDRYKNDASKFRHLKHGDTNASRHTQLLLNKNFGELTKEEKLFLIMYVVYRYRNNIFHGNKGVLGWKSFSTEINYCIEFMIAIIDCSKNHEGVPQ